MTETEFKDHFHDYWKQKYPSDAAHNFKERVDRFQLERSIKTLLYDYAREVQNAVFHALKATKLNASLMNLVLTP